MVRYLTPSHSVPATVASTLLDAFCAVLQKKLFYGPGKRTEMHHEYPTGIYPDIVRWCENVAFTVGCL
ncbi:hypothetical protein SeMB42_g01140 [Synchytrium endobioticum]|uniref:Uncharacterized protein n=1 Tax=Synchytrium endobioticum TaxID=286115 RepID=A0A507DN20_9FUNG|nr:hypothetical protein SeMB42_g01140 [Synchytrium endobioticum]